MTMNTLAKWLVMLLGGMRYPHLAEMILDPLDASTVAYVLDILKILGECPYATKYLNPLRDLGGSVELLRQIEAEGSTALLIGPKLDLITKRIAHPRIYWEALERKYRGDAQEVRNANVVEAWTVCVYKNVRGTMEAAFASDRRGRPGITWESNMCNELQRAGLRQPAMDAETKMSLSTSKESFIGALDLQSHCHRPLTLPGETTAWDYVFIGGLPLDNNWTQRLFRSSQEKGLKEWVEFSYVKPLEIPFRVHRPPAMKFKESLWQQWKRYDSTPTGEREMIARFLFSYTGIDLNPPPSSFYMYFEVPVFCE